MTTAFLIYMLTLGLGTSLHCVSMCGPLVLTYAVKGTEDGPWYRRLTPNLAYQSAKIVSYLLVGLLLGAVGSLINLDSFRPYIMFAAGAFMIVLGLGMTGRVPWAARLTPRPPRWLMDAITRLRKKSTADAQAGESHLTTAVFFGLMTGLLPCGPLMAAQVSAAASGGALTGAVGMAMFGVGTAPLMIIFGTAGSLIPRVWKERMMSILAIGVMIFGLVFINRGLLLTGAPINSNAIKNAFVASQPVGTAQYATGVDGVIEVPLVIDNVRFQPQTLSFPADRPVRLVVDRREANACSDQLAVPQLGVLVNLTPNGVTTVDLPATASGTYTLTCGMGMMGGQLVVGGGASRSVSPLPWLLVAAAAAGAALWLTRRPAGRRGTSAEQPTPGSMPVPAARGVRAPKPSGPVVFGFGPTEIVLIGTAVLVAVMGGLALGGMFTQ